MIYYLAKFFRTVLLFLPLWSCYLIGQAIGTVLYLNPKKRYITFKNIKSVFPTKTNREIKKIMRRSFRNIGLGVIEAFIAPRIFKYLELKGKENIAANGGILVAIHEGSWELYNFYIAKTLRYKMFVKEQKKKVFDKFLNDLRRESSLELCFSLKEMIKSLRDGFVVSLVIDHGAEDNALMVEFFNHLVPTPKGAIYLAKKLNKPIYPCFGYRKKGFRQVVEIGKPVDPNTKDDLSLLRELNRVYEKYLQKYPWEYLWFYKRFKRKKDLDVVVLSDSKAGHLKQSQAFVSIFKEQDYLIRDKIIEIKFKNIFTRFISEVCAFFSGRDCLGCGSCLKFSLKKQTTKELEASYADIVVSTGSLAAPINRVFASAVGAKSVVILRPNTPLRKFDLSIIPEHDRTETKDTVKIKGALCYPTNAKRKTADCKDFFHLNNEKKISFFLGGPLYDARKYTDNLKVFLERIKEFSLKNNYKIILSTSRRTPKDIEEIVEKMLGSFTNTEAAVYPSRINYDFVFDGFISLSEMVFISSESISMISETLALKKPCICLLLEQYLDKHRVFLESFNREVNFLNYPYDIGKIELKSSNVFEENKNKVTEGIKKLL
jgi:lauroyl/myristoyl acyltransferase/mitochondrial fission protein ELM1